MAKKITVKMDPKKKAKWIEALVSGEYEQGEGYLTTNNAYGETQYCCLGVLCEINKVKNVEKLCLPLVKDRKKLGFELSAADKRILDLNSEDDSEIFSTLAEYNDKGKSFKWIAGYIKRYL